MKEKEYTDQMDADPMNGDWPKRTWDLLDVNSIPELHEHLLLQGVTVEQFKESALYKFNVGKLPWLRDL